MRLFYDMYSSRLRGEVLLLGADALSIAAAFLYATGAAHSGCDVADVALFVLWACLPRALAKVVGNTEQTGRHLKAFGGSFIFVVLTAFLIVAGWDLMAAVTTPGRDPESPMVVILLFAWGTGFFLFHARAYRLHDFLLLAVVLFGLKESRPQAYLWLPVFFTGLYLSFSIRHALFDCFEGTRRRMLNIQNARALSFVTTAATLLVFLGTWLLLGGPSEARHGKGAGPGGTGPGGLTADLVDGGRESGRGGQGAGVGGGADGSDQREPGAPGADTTKQVAFSYRIGLRDLAVARFDRSEVLRVSAPGAADWRPPAGILWKGVTFSSFDPGQEIWEEETDFRVRSWPDQGVLPRRLATQPVGRPLTLRHVVITPVFRNLVSPYVTLAYRSGSFAMYRENALGDVFPSPTVETGTVYSAAVRLLEPGILPGEAAQPGSAGRIDPRYLKVPTRREIGFDLRRRAGPIFAGAGPGVREKVVHLRRFFARDFRYSNQAVWRRGESRLDQFLNEEKIGDCTFFSTSCALLLRAAGVPTRLAVGFLGGRWDPEREEVVIRNSEAHAWVEVFFPGSGWFPVDPTDWVPADPSYQAPEEALDELQQLVRRSSAPPPPKAEFPGGRDLPSDPDAGRRRGGSSLSPDRFGDRRSVPVPPDERSLSRSSGWEDDDSLSWIQFGGYFLDDADLKAGDGFGLSGPTPDISEGLDGAEALDGIAVEGRERRRGPLGAVSRSGALRSALRGALAALGVVVLILVVRAFLRPRRAKEDTEEDDEEEESDVDLVSALLPEGVELDERIPRDHVLGEYLRLQAALRRTRTHRRAHQTPLEHARRVSRGDSRLEEAFRALHRILYRIVYGRRPVDEKHAATAERSCRRIRRILG